MANFNASRCRQCPVIAPVYAEMSKNYPQLMFLIIDVDDLMVAWNLVVATVAAPSVRALRAPTTNTSSGSDLLCPSWALLSSSSHRHARRRRHGRGRAVCAFVFFPRCVEPRIQTRRPSNVWHLHWRPLGV